MRTVSADMVGMLIMAVAIILLLGIGITAGYFADKRRVRLDDLQPSAQPSDAGSDEDTRVSAAA